MTKTGTEIMLDFYTMLSNSSIVDEISGKIYYDGQRPRDSVLEDIIIIFTEADAAQVQSGTITLNLYVPFIYNSSDGVAVDNTYRCKVLERLMSDTIDTFTAAKSNYKIKLKKAIHSQRDEDINQSFITARLDFSFFER